MKVQAGQRWRWWGGKVIEMIETSIDFDPLTEDHLVEVKGHYINESYNHTWTFGKYFLHWEYLEGQDAPISR